MATRIFLAIDLPRALRKSLAAWTSRAQPAPGKIRWVQPGNLHVTLHFLGDVADDVLARLCRDARGIVSRKPAFAAEVRGIETIPPSGRRLRMIWALVAGNVQPLEELYDDLGACLGNLELPVERRRYRPHVTLGRIRSCPDARALRRAFAPFPDTVFGDLPVENVTIYSSTLTRKGPEYQALEKLPLGPPHRKAHRRDFSP
jgi:2'-5' RNA ligase